MAVLNTLNNLYFHASLPSKSVKFLFSTQFLWLKFILWKHASVRNVSSTQIVYGLSVLLCRCKWLFVCCFCFHVTVATTNNHTRLNPQTDVHSRYLYSYTSHLSECIFDSGSLVLTYLTLQVLIIMKDLLPIIQSILSNWVADSDIIEVSAHYY